MATALCWAGNLAVTLSFERLVAGVGLAGTFGLYAALSAGAALYVRGAMVETKQRTLAEIERLLAPPLPARAAPSPAPRAAPPPAAAADNHA